MECIDNKGLKYDSFLHQVSVKKPGNKRAYSTTIKQELITIDEIEAVKKEFLQRCSEMPEKSLKNYGKYCIEYKAPYEGKEHIYTEFIMGFLAMD